MLNAWIGSLECGVPFVVYFCGFGRRVDVPTPIPVLWDGMRIATLTKYFLWCGCPLRSALPFGAPDEVWLCWT
jgi:hypothetical protein